MNFIIKRFTNCTQFTEWKLSFGVAQNVRDWHKIYQFLIRPKKFRPTQNILGPVEGQGKCIFF